MEFKDKVKIVRQKLIMSQEELAKALGISYATLHRWENGQTEPYFKGQRAFNELCIKNKIKFED